jgi:hypothetical protein
VIDSTDDFQRGDQVCCQSGNTVSISEFGISGIVSDTADTACSVTVSDVEINSGIDTSPLVSLVSSTGKRKWK